MKIYPRKDVTSLSLVSNFLVFTLFISLILFFISCEKETDTARLINCTEPGGCKASQNCEFDSLESPMGICTERAVCETDGDCDNYLSCIKYHEKLYCGTRKLFSIKDITLEDAIKDSEYITSKTLEVENNSSEYFYFEVTDKTKLPAGLELSEDGKFTGTVTASAGSYSFVVKAVNGKKDSAYYLNYKITTKVLTIKVVDLYNDCGRNCPEHSSCNQVTDKCDCNLGYTGTLCDTCDDGYVGDSCDSCDIGYHSAGELCISDAVCEQDSCTDTNKTVCSVAAGVLTCSCDIGYHDVVGSCIVDEFCEQNSCTDTNKTVCNIVNGLISCSCDTGYHDESGVCVEDYEIAWCNTQWPQNVTENNTIVYGRVKVNNVTSLDEASPLIKSQLCYFKVVATKSEPVCIDAVFNKNVQSSDKDEYSVELNILESGNFNYYYQFKIEGDTVYKKCDLSDGTDYENSETYQGSTGTAVIAGPSLDGNLFISEYIEGRGEQKFIELYAIDGGVNLDGWIIKIAVNGSLYSGASIVVKEVPLDNVILSSDNIFLVSKTTSVGDIASQKNLLLDFNGNDVVGLFNPSGDLIDIIGIIGDDSNFAKNIRLIRKSSVSSATSSYNVDEWLSSAITNTENQEDNLGIHNID